MELLRPWPLKMIFDGLLMPQAGSVGVLADFMLFTDRPELLLAVVSLSILAIAVLLGLFGYGRAYLVASVGQRVVASVRHRLYGHIQQLSPSFHDARDTGDLLARLTGDIRMLRELMVNAVVYLSDRALVLLGMLAVMLWMDWQLTLVALLIVPPLAWIVTRGGRQIKSATRRQRRNESEVTNIMAERISAISVVRAFAQEAREESVFAKRSGNEVKAGLRATRLEQHLNRVVQVILAVGTCAVVWVGASRVRAGFLSPGDLLVFVAYLSSLYKPIQKIASLTSRIAKATACAERVVAILEIEPEIKDAPDALPAPRLSGDIRFQDVEFAYQQGPPVLRGASFHIAAGETVALVGDSGSGKSTVASLLLRFYDPQRGRVLLDGRDIRSFTLVSFREQFAVVLQESVLFKTSIRENIAYGALDADMDAIEAASRAANAHEFIMDLPNGYDTVVGERGATLSGGQRQRIAIARAMIRDAAIVILDESMANLDVTAEAKVAEALHKLINNRTCLMITHNLRAAARADRVFALRDGQVSEITDRAVVERQINDRAVSG